MVLNLNPLASRLFLEPQWKNVRNGMVWMSYFCILPCSTGEMQHLYLCRICNINERMESTNVGRFKNESNEAQATDDKLIWERPWDRRTKAATQWSPKPLGGLLEAGTLSHPKPFGGHHGVTQRPHGGLGPEHRLWSEHQLSGTSSRRGVQSECQQGHTSTGALGILRTGTLVQGTRSYGAPRENMPGALKKSWNFWGSLSWQRRR